MDRDFLEEQKNLVLQRLEVLGDAGTQEKHELTIVSEYLSSLLHPEKYNDAEKEDLRKLALELDYKEDTDLSEWEATSPHVATP